MLVCNSFCVWFWLTLSIYFSLIGLAREVLWFLSHSDCQFGNSPDSTLDLCLTPFSFWPLSIGFSLCFFLSLHLSHFLPAPISASSLHLSVFQTGRVSLRTLLWGRTSKSPGGWPYVSEQWWLRLTLTTSAAYQAVVPTNHEYLTAKTHFCALFTN